MRRALFLFATLAFLACSDSTVGGGTDATALTDGGTNGDGAALGDGGGSTTCACDPTQPAITGSTIHVAAGDDLQAALDRAEPGDAVVLDAGATWSGSFTLGAKSGSGWITVTSSAIANLPPCNRVFPSLASQMPKIVTSASTPVFATAPGAHHWRLVGLEIAVAPNVAINYGIVQLGDGTETSMDQLPHDLVIDRCYIHGDPTSQVKRGIALNSASTDVRDSYVSECHLTGQDSQAIAGWNGPGPFRIVDNHVEGAGENVIFGGADPKIANLVPSDIEIRYNHIAKQERWFPGASDYDGSHWSVKNSVELKNARRVTIDGNLVEYNWADAQVGFAIVLTPRNQDGTAPWSTVEDVTFTHNLVRHSASAVNMLGTDNDQPSQRMTNVTIRDNVFDDIDGQAWGGGSGIQWQILDGPVSVTIDHNTALNTGNVGSEDGTTPTTSFVYTNNLTPHNLYGFFCSGLGEGNPCLDMQFPNATFTHNVLWAPPSGFNPSSYPAGNWFPSSEDMVGFTDPTHGDYTLTAMSMFHDAATDGRDVGADLAALSAALQCNAAP